MIKLPEVYLLDKADRHEMFELLERLTAADRLSWLVWCTQFAKGPGGSVVSLDPKTIGELREVYLDWTNLTMHLGVSVHDSRAELERRVKLFGTPLAFAGGFQLLEK